MSKLGNFEILEINLNFEIFYLNFYQKVKRPLWNVHYHWYEKENMDMSSWKSSKEGDLPLCILPKREILRKPFRDRDFSRLFLGPKFGPIPNGKRACIFPKSR